MNTVNELRKSIKQARELMNELNHNPRLPLST